MKLTNGLQIKQKFFLLNKNHDYVLKFKFLYRKYTAKWEKHITKQYKEQDTIWGESYIHKYTCI